MNYAYYNGMDTIKYNKGLDIRNVGNLPIGLGCHYLIVIKGLNGEYIAKQWKRKLPATLAVGETLITF